jgi:hypothetical protein
MDLQPLRELLEAHRGHLKKLEVANGSGMDGLALAELRSVLRVRISTIEVALRYVADHDPGLGSERSAALSPGAISHVAALIPDL